MSFSVSSPTVSSSSSSNEFINSPSFSGQFPKILQPFSPLLARAVDVLGNQPGWNEKQEQLYQTIKKIRQILNDNNGENSSTKMDHKRVATQSVNQIPKPGLHKHQTSTYPLRSSMNTLYFYSPTDRNDLMQRCCEEKSKLEESYNKLSRDLATTINSVQSKALKKRKFSSGLNIPSKKTTVYTFK